MNFIKLIPTKILVNYFPEILAYILTKVLGYILLKNPNKAEKVIETAKEITKALSEAVEFAKDGIITKDEVKEQIEAWKVVFK